VKNLNETIIVNQSSWPKFFQYLYYLYSLFYMPAKEILLTQYLRIKDYKN
jgi:hypothetical protein